ncbi:MAG: hypothetical protein AAFW87_05430 [Pseudomonadota bacterium]
MGFPFDTPTWDSVSGAIFPGMGSAMPGAFTVIAIAICIVALLFGNGVESSKYKNHK